MKMANIDAVFNFMFTNPKKRDGVSFVLPQMPHEKTIRTVIWH